MPLGSFIQSIAIVIVSNDYINMKKRIRYGSVQRATDSITTVNTIRAVQRIVCIERNVNMDTLCAVRVTTRKVQLMLLTTILLRGRFERI